ncbi:RNA polymerase factor sigma-54 [Flavihumibacter fluvii]|uniref:RNA polymerase factor sigma-54 n=1 Tax=Flavihumibacter fluvii TaxID=2838157 RepID=UPI001BDF30DF|nr:RNA polymerase factor sigma-54 [Flavihumibacter fluvii]ULQ51876.1 RNA polymerase factor sigma-54 [Flavihumibacter fluvii]
MISQRQQQHQTLKILPQQIQLLNLFQLNNLELQMHLRQEMDQNPYLEEIGSNEEVVKDNFDPNGEQEYKDWEEYAYNDLADYKTEHANYFSSENIPEKPIAAIPDFRAEAKQVLMMSTTDDRLQKIAAYLIDSLEESGFLEKDLESVADDFSFSGFMTTPEEVQAALQLVQALEPVGLGCRDIRECWLLQLKRMHITGPGIQHAIELLEKYYEDFKSRRFEKIMAELGIEQHAFRAIVELLGKLPMRPVAEQQLSISPKDNIVPDVEISLDNDVFTITVGGITAENFKVSDSLKENMQKTTDKAALQFLRSKMQSANWILYALRQRNESMLKIIKAIVNLQKEYFTEGDITKLQPMILKNIADQVGLDISTVSRLTSNKYADTHFGTIHLKDLFTEGIINKTGEVISNRVIRNALEELIEQEDKKNPFTDQQLVEILMNKGIKVARRTIAKYRDLMQIPVAQLRSMWA